MTYTRQERLLTVYDLSLSFGSKRILRNVDLEIDNLVRPGMQQGQIVALLGPSGIGKTQLFRCIAGLNPPTSGSVTLGSSTTPVRAGEVGVVFQNYPLLKHRTVWGNLKLAADRVGKKDEDIAAMLTEFGLLDKRDLYPSQISGGQRQRIAIIQQMLCSSGFILMDEPFSGLDPVMKQRVMTMISSTAQKHEHNTFILTTHDIESAVAICDTIWVLGWEYMDTDNGRQLVPGATCIQKFDLIQRGLAWNPEPKKHPNFFPTVREIEELFQTIV